MLAYLVRRVLLMVPTFVGISLAIWLVMTLAPGEPERGGAAQAAELAQRDPAAEARGDEARRLFRRQFNLDRPRFWNSWPSLEVEDVLEDLDVIRAGIAESGATAVKEARRRLDDYQSYAVGPLIAALSATASDPTRQDLALYYLRKASYQLPPVYAATHVPTAEEAERAERARQRNRMLASKEYVWLPDATPATRQEVVANWKAFWELNRGEFESQGWEKIKVGFTDTQFGKYWANLLRGDLGLSNVTKNPVLGEILSRLKYSLSLAVPAFLISWVLAILLGVFGASHHRSAADQLLGVLLFMLWSVPSFVAGTVLQRWLAVELGWFPVSEFESPHALTTLTTWEHLKDILLHIALPLLTYVYGSLAYISRQARSGMLEVLRSDYVRTARAKGLPERTVVWKHAVRNGMMPVVTLLGTALPILLAGSVFIETIFNIDGFGRLMIRSILLKDYNVVMGVQLVVAALTLIGLLLTDLIYAAMDPRISYK